MRIVFTSYSSSPEYKDMVSWLERIIAYNGILEHMSKNHSVHSVERIGCEGKHVSSGVSYHFIRQEKRVVYFPRRLHKKVKELRPDFVLVHGLIFPLQVIQLRMALGRHVKIICLHHAEKPYKRWGRIVQRLADWFVDAYLFTSTEFGKQWVEQGNISRKEKIYEVMEASSVFSPADKTKARNRLSIKASPVFLWVGRLNENKDPLTVVNAFIRFHRHCPSASLYMIFHEDDLLSEILHCIKKEDAGAFIHLVGKIPHEQLGNWYNSADFILSGSHYEGSGVAVCEAMSCGCIPVLTNIMSFRRMTGPGKCGFLYEPGNAEQLLSLLVQTIHLDWEKERTKTLQQFKEELSFEAIARKIEAVIASV